MTTLLLAATVTGYHAPLAPFNPRRHGRAVACADAEPPEFLTLASLGLNADEQAALEVLLQKHDVREREREIDGIPPPWEAGDVAVDDPKSRLYQLFHDDFDGLFARRRQWEQAVAGRKLWLTAWQPTLIAAPLIAGWFAPRRAAAWCARSSFALHLGLPLLWLGAASLRQRRRARRPEQYTAREDFWVSNEVLGYASAAHVLYGQHATAAAAAAVPVVLLVAGGQPLTALVVAAASRVAMLFGFWWWRDVRAALLYTGLQRRWFEGVARVWRLLVSALCLAELALCARLLAAANAAARTAAVQQAAMTAALAGFPTPLAAPAVATVRVLLAPVMAAAAAARAACGAPLCAFLGAVAAMVGGAYALWWAAFPAEGLSRRAWFPSVMPDRGGTRTLSTLLMACAGVAKPYPPFAEHAAMLDNPTSGPLGGGDAGADAFPLADFRLSPTRDNFVEPMTFDPDTSLSILSLMDAENATEREQNRWDRSAPENYRLGNTTLTGVGKLRFALRKWAAPRRPPEDRTKLILEALPQAGFSPNSSGSAFNLPPRGSPEARESAGRGGGAAKTADGMVAEGGVGEGEAPRAMPGPPPDVFEV